MAERAFQAEFPEGSQPSGRRWTSAAATALASYGIPAPLESEAELHGGYAVHEGRDPACLTLHSSLWRTESMSAPPTFRIKSPDD
jgi:hypothetical protein